MNFDPPFPPIFQAKCPFFPPPPPSQFTLITDNKAVGRLQFELLWEESNGKRRGREGGFTLACENEITLDVEV